MSSNKEFIKNLWQLNLALGIVSTSGVLGKYINLPVPFIIFIRCLLGGLALFAYIRYKKIPLKIRTKSKLYILLGGVFLGIHWITYFYSLKLASVAVAKLSLYTFPFFTALFRPLVLKEKMDLSDIGLGGIILVGIYFIAPDFDINPTDFYGMLFGLISAIVYAFRNIIIESKSKDENQSTIMFYQLTTVSVILCPTVISTSVDQVVDFLPSLLLLGIGVTAVAHTLIIQSIKYFSSTSASIISSIEPIFGIFLAWVFLDEIPNQNTVIGGIIIISATILGSLKIHKKLKRK